MQFAPNDSRHNYTGQLNDENEFSGRGRLVWKNGDYYVGGWLHGIQSGTGKMVYANHDEVQSYSGDWINGTMTGNGTLIWKNGDRYTGGVEDGLMSGQGVFHWPDGRVYEGHFANGLHQGFGKLKFQEDNPLDLDYYEGQWKDDSATGFGRMIWKNGKRHDGNFRNGFQDGPGVLYSEQNDVIIEGRWEQGQFSA